MIERVKSVDTTPSATTASAIHRLFEVDLKEEQSLLHTYASSLEGPAAPLLCRAACLMPSASRPSNVMGLTGSDSPSTREQASGSLPKVCFSFKTSLVDCSMDSPVFVVSGTRSSNLSTPPFVFLVSQCTLNFPL